MVEPDRFSTGQSNRELHRHDISPHYGSLVDEYHVAGYVFGHAGDGNLHVVIAGDPADKRQWATLENINQFIVEKAVEMGGTCTGEHGIGIGKRKFMQLEHGDSYHLMRDIKELIDPKGLMNPGKIFI